MYAWSRNPTDPLYPDLSFRFGNAVETWPLVARRRKKFEISKLKLCYAWLIASINKYQIIVYALERPLHGRFETSLSLFNSVKLPLSDRTRKFALYDSNAS